MLLAVDSVVNRWCRIKTHLYEFIQLRITLFDIWFALISAAMRVVRSAKDIV